MKKLSIIIPAHREADNIANCVKRTAAVCPTAEIIVLDSGIDNTKEIITTLKNEIPGLIYHHCQPDRGKGDAIGQGIKLAQGDIIIQLDADLQFMPEEIPQLIAPILAGTAAMTLGSRFCANSTRVDGSTPPLRSLGNWLISLQASILFGQKISDALAGFKAWDKKVTQSFTLTSYTFSYEVELFAKALRHGFKVMDVAIRTEPRLAGVSSVSVFRAGINIIKDTFVFRFS